MSRFQASMPDLFKAADLVAFGARMLTASGVPEAHSTLTAAALVEADLEGIASHGLGLLPLYLDRIATGSVAPEETGEIVSRNGAAIVVDARNGLGQVTSELAVNLSLQAAAVHGAGIVAVRNGFHFGTAGHWARSIAEKGCIGMAFSNTRPLMPAPGGAEPVVGNNPLAIAMPGNDPQPFTLDLALSAVAMGRIRIAAAEGREIEPGWAVDSEGVPTTDAMAAISGMLLPAAGPKGFGLAMMIDCLCGGLSSGAIGREVGALYGNLEKPYGCSHLFVAIRVESFRPLDDFKEATSRLAHDIRNSRRAPGTTRIMVPGEPAALEVETSGGLCGLPAATVSALRERASERNIPFPTPTARNR